jgi:hypothetical protein
MEECNKIFTGLVSVHVEPQTRQFRSNYCFIRSWTKWTDRTDYLIRWLIDRPTTYRLRVRIELFYLLEKRNAV